MRQNLEQKATTSDHERHFRDHRWQISRDKRHQVILEGSLVAPHNCKNHRHNCKNHRHVLQLQALRTCTFVQARQ